MSKRTTPPAVAGNRVSPRSEYRNGYARQAEHLCKLGATVEELAEWFGVSASTINAWMHEHREFYYAVRDGRKLADARVAQALYTRAVGYEAKEKRIEQSEEGVKVVDATKHVAPDVGAIKFWLTNRRPDLWQDRKEVTVEHTGDLASRILEARKRARGEGLVEYQVEEENPTAATVDSLVADFEEDGDDWLS